MKRVEEKTLCMRRRVIVNVSCNIINQFKILFNLQGLSSLSFKTVSTDLYGSFIRIFYEIQSTYFYLKRGFIIKSNTSKHLLE